MAVMWKSECCGGEKCTMCGAPAVAKVGEEVMPDDPYRNRHNLTAYVCETHFRQIFKDPGVDWLNEARQQVIDRRG